MRRPACILSSGVPRRFKMEAKESHGSVLRDLCDNESASLKEICWKTAGKLCYTSVLVACRAPARGYVDRRNLRSWTMKMGGDSVDVVIAAWNSERTIGRAVRSALLQRRVAQVIVVDDASTDATGAAARTADDGSGRLTVIRLNENGGPARARNVALDHSRSPCFCILDADDYLLPDRMDRLLAAADRPWDLLADNIVIVPLSLGHLEIRLGRADAHAPPIELDLAPFIRGNISRPGRPRAETGFLKPVVRRAFLDRHRIRYNESLRLAEDYALCVQALIAGARYLLVGACGYVAIARDDSISARHSGDDLQKIAAFDAACLADHPELPSAARAALAAHHRTTLHKYHHRVVLACRRERGVLPALATLGRFPASVPHIVAETVRAKLDTRLVARRTSAPPQARLLLDLPLGEPALSICDEPDGDSPTRARPAA
jgi:succinoglycan biosynthesis protein ExoU